jgi:hypothetical protein
MAPIRMMISSAKYRHFSSFSTSSVERSRDDQLLDREHECEGGIGVDFLVTMNLHIRR